MILRSRRVSQGLVLLALALGFAVRVYRLDTQSLWNDEGTSVALARLSLPAIANGAAHDIHPPLYYFLLHFWMTVAGDGEFAVRFLSVLAGVLLIAATYRVARILTRSLSLTGGGEGEGTALVAAFLSALSSFELYYSQETRMYIWVALFGALSALALAQWLNLLQTPHLELRITNYELRVLCLYVCTTLAALYTHYFAPTLSLFENLAFAVWLALAYRARRPSVFRTLAFWVGAQVVVVLTFLPWLAFAGNQLTSWPAISEQYSPVELTWRVLSAFAVGIDTPVGIQVYIVVAFGILFLAGLILGFRQNAWGLIAAALWAVVPLAFMYVVSLQRPAYNPKFLLLSTPGWLILVARGITRLSTLSLRSFAPVRTVPLFLFAGLALAGASAAINGVYFDPRLQRDDYRGVIGYVNRVATPEDVVIVDAPGQMDVFNYYYRGAAKVQALPIGRPMLREETREALAGINQGDGNIFAVYWATEQADPQRFVEQYLGTSSFKALDEWHGNIRLAQYAQSGARREMTRVDRPSKFGDEIWLQAFGLPTRPIQPGRAFPVSLKWSALRKPAANYKVFAHLLDAQGQMISQRDSEPLDSFQPTSSWLPSQTVVDLIGLRVPLQTPPGEYIVEVGLYRPEDGTRLRVTEGYREENPDHLILGTVRVEN